MRTYFIFGSEQLPQYTLLMTACMEGDAQEARRLIEADHDMDATIDGMTALTYAIIYKQDACARLLIERGADTKKAEKTGSKWGATPLIAACKEGNVNIARILIMRGAHVENASDIQGSTALMVACECGHDECVDLLFKNETGLTDEASRLATWSTSSGNATFYVSISMPTQFRRDQMAEKHAERLFEGGAFVTLDRAKANVQVELEQSADNRPSRARIEVRNAFRVVDSYVNLRNNTWKTALMYACKGGYETIAEMLILKGADMYAFDLQGNTALSFAAMYGHRNCFDLLVSKGDDYFHENLDGHSILQLFETSENTGRTDLNPNPNQPSEMATIETGS